MSLQSQFEQVQQRIAQACLQAHRKPSEVSLIAVSKTFPLALILEAMGYGQHHFGENYVQEAETKILQFKQLNSLSQPIRWHFIGPLQSNKTKPVAEYFDWVHSIDRLKIAQRLSAHCAEIHKTLNILVQVNTSNESTKSGVTPEQVLPLCLQLQQLPNIKLCGLMTITSNTNDSKLLETEFALCHSLLQQLKTSGIHTATELSMGMSADLELAIKHGATMVRIGSALFGQRNTQH